MVMKNLKENKRFRYALGALLLVLLCYNLPNLLFFPLCIKEDIFRPPNTEVLVSACKKPGVRGVPGGEVLFVREAKTNKIYLLDLRTGEKRKVPTDPLLLDKGVFLNSDLVWLEGSLVGSNNPDYRPHYILDLTDGKIYELLNLFRLPTKDGKFDTIYYEYFQSADKVFIHHRKNVVIALSSSLSEDINVIFFQSSLGTRSEGYKNGELLEQLLKDLSVNYEIIDFSLYDTYIPSPTNKYIARFDGIYDGIYIVETNEQVIDGIFNYFKSWYYDDSAVIVQGGGDYLLTLPGISSVYYIPSPVLKLKLPEP